MINFTRSKMKKSFRVFHLFLLIVLISAGCAPDQSHISGDITSAIDGDLRTGGTLVVGLAADSIVTFDPAAYSDRVTETVIRNIFDGLVTRTIDNQVVLEIASAYTWVDDQTIEFELKEDVFFHNGEKLTSEDVVFTVERIINQEVGAPRRVFLAEVESVEALDKYTVRFNLNNPWPVFLQMLVHVQIVPKDYVLEVGDDKFAYQPIGSGPFQFTDGTWITDIYLSRFDDYHGGASKIPPIGPARLDGVIFKFLPDPEERLTALENGEIHILQSLPPSQVPALVENPEIIIKTAVGTRPKFIDLNVSTPPFDNQLIRQALNYAIDAQAILDDLYDGFGIILPGPLSPANQYADTTLDPYGFDQDKARELILEAGYQPDELFFTLDTPDQYFDIGKSIEEQLEQLGIQVTVIFWDYSDVKPLLLNCQRQAFLRDWGDSAFDPVGYIEAKWHTRIVDTPAGRGNFSCYSNGRVDELIQLGASEPDPEIRRGYYNELQQVVFDEAPAVFLFVPQDIEAASVLVKNWQPSPDSRINLHDVWLDLETETE